jgi:hypothetical protein
MAKFRRSHAAALLEPPLYLGPAPRNAAGTDADAVRKFVVPL